MGSRRRYLFLVSLLALSLAFSCNGGGDASPSPATSTPAPAQSPEPLPSAVTAPPESITVLAKESRYNGADRLDEYTVLDWDASGRVLRSRTLYDAQRSGVQGKNVFEYDSSGRVASEAVYGPENALKYRLVTTYDERGLKATEVRRDPRGTTILTSRFSYDADGNRTSWKIFMGESELVGETEYRYEGGLLSRITMRARENEYRGMIQIERDKKGREASRTNISVRGTTESYESYEYDGDKRVGETKTGVSGRILLTIMYDYDGEGNLLKRTVKNDKGKVKEYTVYEYARKEAGPRAE